jgi:hypothetical protein
MATFPPPSAPPAPSGTPAPNGQGETRVCPVCTGGGEIPATMSKGEMVQAIDGAMPNPEDPERGEIERLSARATERMRSGNNYGVGGV